MVEKHVICLVGRTFQRNLTVDAAGKHDHMVAKREVCVKLRDKRNGKDSDLARIVQPVQFGQFPHQENGIAQWRERNIGNLRHQR